MRALTINTGYAETFRDNVGFVFRWSRETRHRSHLAQHALHCSHTHNLREAMFTHNSLELHSEWDIVSGT